MSLIHLARQGFITKSALPNVTRQRGTTTGTANLMLYGAGKTHSIGTNTTFTDSSSNNFTVTRNGDTIQATNNPFTGSVYFDGNGDYLTLAPGAAFQFGTGDFTVEMFVNFSNASNAYAFFVDARNSSQTTAWCLFRGNTGNLTWNTGSAELAATFTTTNTWQHIAYTRASNTGRLFINGVLAASWTDSTNYSVSPTTSYIGSRYSISEFTNGYITNLRVVKGTAVYTANFTVPTSPLTAITNTQLLLLTAQQAPFRDSSTNNFTVTANGNAAGSGLEPFPVNYAGSGYFDGTGDYLTVTNSAALQLTDATAFTIECWVYPTNLTSPSKYIFENFNSSSPFQGYGLAYNINSTNAVEWWDGGGTWANTGITLTTNEWTHIAVTYEGSGTTRRFFKNGVLSGSAGTVSSSINYTAGACSIGAQEAGNSPWFGYISNLRIIKGTAQYTAAFTPPAAPLTAVTNTQLLLLTNNVGPFVDTSANGLPVLRNGDAVQTGFSPFTGQPSAGSGYFDGNGDYLTATGQNLSAGNWTIECWVYFSSFTNTTPHIFNFGTNVNNRYVLFRSSVNSKFIFTTANGGVYTDVNSTTTPQIGTWYHVAVVRNSGVSTLYINGSQEGTSNTSIDSGTNWSIGFQQFGGITNDYINGYISNFRVVKGTAVYTSNFTPATAPLPAVPNTSLLLNTDNYTIANSTPTYLPVTVVGNTTVSTAQYPTGMNRSIYFDGNGDYLQVPDNTAFAFGTGDFTVELFINFSILNSNAGYVSQYNGPTTGWYIRNDAANTFVFGFGDNIIISATWTKSTNTWYHISATRSGTTLKLFIDGVESASVTNSTNITSSGATLKIGALAPQLGSYANWFFTGYISNVRIVKGSALYTANFTPPAAPLPLSVTVPNNVTNNIYGVYQLA